ncbi:MAG: hypothetical protein KC503_27040 [Myxococcales bacterium]|nr:hypothetical protein [Myxococcales bacterium]
MTESDTRSTRPPTGSSSASLSDEPLSRDPLDGAELCALLERVFAPRADERALAVLVDLPDQALPDSEAWRDRRQLAAEWVRALEGSRFAAQLFGYRNVRRNNAELPETLVELDAYEPLPLSMDDARLAAIEARARDAVLAEHPMVLAPTQLSATAPLKLLAPRLGFSAATMGGLSRAMQPALRLDYIEIDRRVRALAALVERADTALFDFVVDGARALALTLDLRHRPGHASGGLLRERGRAGNLPSGEAYIVPYEGERAGEPSRSAGELPVELDGEVVIYRVEQNRARAVEGDGPVAARERALIASEPAYANIAELGLGVLSDFGVKPVGVTLLDEKLGPHIAFGRSDHFGGQVGPGDFSSPEAVVHIDRVYLPETQPRVRLERIRLQGRGDAEPTLLYETDASGRGHYAVAL